MKSKHTHNYNPTYLLLPTQQITVHEENMLITALLVVKTVGIIKYQSMECIKCIFMRSNILKSNKDELVLEINIVVQNKCS